MQTHRWIQRSIRLSAVALVTAAPVMFGQWNQQGPRQGQELFEWRGSVDREVQIVMRGSRLWTNNVGYTEPNNERSRTFSSLPSREGEVVVRMEDGRGRVDVIQQPTRQNGYTAIVRIQDPRGGSDAYRLAAYWQSYSNGDVYGRNNRGNERSHGQRGDEMRSRDRDGDGDIDRNDRIRDRDRDGDVDRNDRIIGRQTMLHWSGNVDDELEIRIQNGRVEYRTVRGAQPTSIRVNAGNATSPRNGASVAVMQNQGRGLVQLVQQASLLNGYTTVIRVRDPQGGYGFYDFDLVWQ